MHARRAPRPQQRICGNPAQAARACFCRAQGASQECRPWSRLRAGSCAVRHRLRHKRARLQGLRPPARGGRPCREALLHPKGRAPSPKGPSCPALYGRAYESVPHLLQHNRRWFPAGYGEFRYASACPASASPASASAFASRFAASNTSMCPVSVSSGWKRM